MERNIFEKQRDLNDRLNRYRDEYYNRNAPSVSDEVYDRLFDELKELEQETGIQMAKFANPDSRLSCGEQAGENQT